MRFFLFLFFFIFNVYMQPYGYDRPDQNLKNRIVFKLTVNYFPSV